jgi:hypothetical protein
MRDADVAQQIVDGVVTAEERVQAGFENIAVAVAPGGKLSAQDVAFFENDCRPSGVGEILGGGEPRGAPADDERVGIGRDEQTKDLEGRRVSAYPVRSNLRV